MVAFLQYAITGVLIGILYAVIALAFIVIYRGARLFNLAQGEIVAVSGYLVAGFVAFPFLPFPLAVLAAFACSIGLGVAIERIVFRPMVDQPIFAVVMITIGMMILLRGVMLMIWGPEPRIFPQFFPAEPVRIGPLLFPQSIFWGGVISLPLIAAISWFFEKTLRGLTMSAVAESHAIAQSLGISVIFSTAVAWGMAGGLSTFAAITFLSGQSLTSLVADIGMRAIPVALLAGLESIWGALLAGIIIGVGESLAVGYLDPYTVGSASEGFPYIMMVIILLIRPQGLFGWKIIERV
jgi:branched-chain amino acid transport system permease protein